jgi:hypothetical protein
VPLVSEFFGIRIYMYWNDHMPPHFHAEYGGTTALIGIEDAAVLRGILPFKQLKLAVAWCELHRDQLMKNWNAARRHEAIVSIDPLS